MREYVDTWEAWMACKQCHHVRYKDLKTSYEVEAGGLIEFLSLNPQLDTVQSVLEKYRPERARPDEKGLHFLSQRYERPLP